MPELASIVKTRDDLPSVGCRRSRVTTVRSVPGDFSCPLSDRDREPFDCGAWRLPEEGQTLHGNASRGGNVRKYRSPPEEDRELRRRVILAAVQGFAREALVILLREVWRGGPW